MMVSHQRLGRRTSGRRAQERAQRRRTPKVSRHGQANTRACHLLVFLLSVLAPSARAQTAGEQVSAHKVTEAMHRAVIFFRQNASTCGGYVYQLSTDLSKREGEGRVGKSTAWVEPPATPSVGTAYLSAYRLCGDPNLLDAAKETARALVRGQLRSGGWDNRIEFDPQVRTKYSYRVDPVTDNKSFNTTTFDDDKTQSATRFLMQLDQELGFDDRAIHECVMYALDATLMAQYSCGAWPQRYSGGARPQRYRGGFDPSDSETRTASIPGSWSRIYPGERYADHYTLNDDTLSDLIVTMLDAWDVYDDQRYLDSAIRGGEFLLRAQLPEPQPGWAQQYDHDMHPAWARKFEPPAISGGESQGVMRTLLTLHRRTAWETENASRFLEPIPRAIEYFRRSLLDDGRLARFYELGTNRPLFFTKKYELVYTPDDLPTHYGFVVKSKLDAIEKEYKQQHEQEYERFRQTQIDGLPAGKPKGTPKRNARFGEEVLRLIRELDSRGAWVEPGRLRYHGSDDTTSHVIRSDTFARNLVTLARWLAAAEP